MLSSSSACCYFCARPISDERLSGEQIFVSLGRCWLGMFWWMVRQVGRASQLGLRCRCFVRSTEVCRAMFELVRVTSLTCRAMFEFERVTCRAFTLQTRGTQAPICNVCQINVWRIFFSSFKFD